MLAPSFRSRTSRLRRVGPARVLVRCCGRAQPARGPGRDEHRTSPHRAPPHGCLPQRVPARPLGCEHVPVRGAVHKTPCPLPCVLLKSSLYMSVQDDTCRKRSVSEASDFALTGCVRVCSVLRELASGTAALVEWRLQTGRTHQIRVHAQHLGCPLVADADYGGVGLAHSLIGRGRPDRCAPQTCSAPASQVTSAAVAPRRCMLYGVADPLACLNLSASRQPSVRGMQDGGCPRAGGCDGAPSAACQDAGLSPSRNGCRGRLGLRPASRFHGAAGRSGQPP